MVQRILLLLHLEMVIWNLDLIQDLVCNIIKFKPIVKMTIFFSGPVTIKSQNKLQVDQWYHVQIERRMKEGQMKIDNQTTIHGKSHGRSRGMNIHSPIYFGGTNSKSSHFSFF